MRQGAVAVIALGGLVALAVGLSRRERGGGLAEAMLAVVRRHVPADDFEGFSSAVRDHIAAGKPATRAALTMLASVHLDPDHVDAIKRELRERGLVR